MSVSTSARRLVKRRLPWLVHVHNRYTNRKFRDMAVDEVFHSIYEANSWDDPESMSGEGSGVEMARELVELLPGFLAAHDIGSLLDLPCGDFNWMRHVDLSGIDYIGADIVDELVERNRAEHAGPGRTFERLDLTTDPLPAVDLVFARDCLVHLSDELIRAAFRNIAAAGIPFAMVTTYPESSRNHDIVTGGWRKLNFERAPFDFPPPVDVIHEKCREGRYFADKTMAMWRVADLAI